MTPTLNGLKRRPMILTLPLLTIAVVIISVAFLTMRVSSQEASPQNLKVLIQQLNDRMVTEPGFLITFQFQTPLVENESAWTIGDPKDERERKLTELGNDYVCLTERGGQAIFTRCIPFTNIVSISYLEN